MDYKKPTSFYFMTINLLCIVSQAIGEHNARLDEKHIFPPQTISHRMVGGEEAEERFAPYQVSLQTIYKVHFCGGAIIGDRWIITAGHCVHERDAKGIMVLTGTQNLKNHTGKYYYVDRIVMHCGFNQPVYANDIALINLSESIEYNDHTSAMDYDFVPLQEGAELILTGWGTLSLGGTVPEKLQKLAVKLVPFEDCREAHGNSTDVDLGHLCTFNDNGKGACRGDSGGPLVHNGKLVAVVNWGLPCAKGYPDVHAKISYYHDFIRTHLGSGCKLHVP